MADTIQNTEDRLMDFISHCSYAIGNYKKDVDMGKAMLELGSKTEAIQKLETFCFNPIQGMLDMREQADRTLFKVVNSFMSVFFVTNKEKGLIKNVFKKNNENSLLYFIVLNNDDFDNRNEIFDFLSYYSTLDLADKIPVYFQIVPEFLSSKFEHEEIIA
jgi:hypothetical protein